MAKPDNGVRRILRENHNYWKKFDIGLLAEFEGAKVEPKLNFYNKIEEALKGLEKRIFLPHKEVENWWGPRRVYEVVNEIIVPSLDIALFYAGLAGADAGMMVQKATQERIPVICFYELKKRDQVATLTRPLTTCVDTIIFEEEARGIERLKEAVAKFYVR